MFLKLFLVATNYVNDSDGHQMTPLAFSYKIMSLLSSFPSLFARNFAIKNEQGDY